MADPAKSPSMTINSARTKTASTAAASTKKPRRKEKVEDKKKEAEEGRFPFFFSPFFLILAFLPSIGFYEGRENERGKVEDK